jgi:hypothetical protein
MGKASRTKSEPDRRARIAAQRAEQRRAEQRRRIYLAGGSILVVVIVVVAFVLIKLNSNSGGTAAPSSNGPTGTALTKVVNDVTSVPTSVTDKVAGGTIPSAMFVAATTPSEVTSMAQTDGSYFATVDGPALTQSGKPEVLFMGSEYCPFCAAQRWAMVNAFSRFGTFTGLTTTHSSSSDTDPNTPTLTFYGSTYTSKYLTFVPVENETVTHTLLQNTTAAQQSLWEKYDTSSSGLGYPFIDFGNQYSITGPSYDPGVLAGLTWDQVATALQNPASTVAQGADGAANLITAAICKMTNGQPGSVCSSAGVVKASASL